MLISAVIIAVASFHLIYGFRTGKVIMGTTWRATRAESPVAFWGMMLLCATWVAGGLYLGIIGIPDPDP